MVIKNISSRCRGRGNGFHVLPLKLFIILFCAGNIGAQDRTNLNTSNFKRYDALFSNPAAIGLVPTTQAVVGLEFLHTGLPNDQLRYMLAAAIQPVGRNTVIGMRGTFFTSNLLQQGEFSLLLSQSLLEGVVSLAANVNLLAYSYDSDKFFGFDFDDPLVDEGLSRNVFSFGAGLMLHPTSHLALGFSVDHMNTPSIAIDDSASFDKERIYKFGFTYLNNLLVPQIDIKLEEQTTQVQAALGRKFSDGTISAFVGYNYLSNETRDLFAEVGYAFNRFALLYNFQYPLGDFSRVSSGSHRFTFRFSRDGFKGIYSGLDVRLLNPEVAESDTNLYRISGYASSKVGVAAIEIIRNGQLAMKRTFDRKTPSVDLQETIALQEGENVIQVRAYSDKAVKSRIITVLYYPGVRPPQITLHSPAQAVSDSGRYRLRASIHDTRGLVAIEIRKNEQEISSILFSKKMSTATVDTMLDLMRGPNAIRLIAKNDQRSSETQISVMYRRTPKNLPPPAIVIASPESEQQVTSASVLRLEAGLSNIASLGDIVVKVGGTPVEISETDVEWLQDNRLVMRKQLNLDEGENRIEVHAFSDAGHHISKEIRVLYNPMADSSLYRKTWAVIIGIDEYRDPIVKDLEFAVSDAKALKAFLVENFAVDRFITLYNEDATRDRIIAALSDSLRNTEFNDRVIVFFAGHGFTETTREGALGYIVPYEGAWGSYTRNISMELIRETARIPKAKHIFYIMDACYSGLLLASRGGTIRKPRADIDYRRIWNLASQPARLILTAGKQNQEVLDGGFGTHSIFTSRLLEGLQGAADRNGDYHITATELSEYVREKVSQDARLRHTAQDPAFGRITPDEGEFIFIRKFK